MLEDRSQASSLGTSHNLCSRGNEVLRIPVAKAEERTRGGSLSGRGDFSGASGTDIQTLMVEHCGDGGMNAPVKSGVRLCPGMARWKCQSVGQFVMVPDGSPAGGPPD